jgi:FixJ family two-component response regulator
MQTAFQSIDAVPLPIRDFPRVVTPENWAAEPLPDRVALVVSEDRTRSELSALLAAQQVTVASFASAACCLEFLRTQSAACLIADMHLPDLSGLELQRQVAASVRLPVIFVSGPCDPASVVCAMKSGAIEFLMKPVDPEILLAAVQAAFAQQCRLRSRHEESRKLEARFSRLTPREREVFALVARGLQNKQAAALLGIANITLQIHRGNVMRKMQAGCFAELVRIALRLRIC